MNQNNETIHTFPDTLATHRNNPTITNNLPKPHTYSSTNNTDLSHLAIKPTHTIRICLQNVGMLQLPNTQKLQEIITNSKFIQTDILHITEHAVNTHNCINTQTFHSNLRSLWPNAKGRLTSSNATSSSNTKYGGHGIIISPTLTPVCMHQTKTFMEGGPQQ
jgi:hypothetical protein